MTSMSSTLCLLTRLSVLPAAGGQVAKRPHSQPANYDLQRDIRALKIKKSEPRDQPTGNVYGKTYSVD